jgi:ribosomal protein S18 acetylase RimI-like enzyme
MVEPISYINSEDSDLQHAISDSLYLPTIEKIKAVLDAYCNSGSEALFGYYENNKLKGIIGISKGVTITIKHIGVIKKYRNRGIGRLLVQYLKNHYKKSLIAETDASSVEFYEKLGFAIQECIKEYNGEKVTRYRCKL